MLKSIVIFLALSFAMPAFAWTDVTSMNKHIDQTNFIVGQGCSGTLISIEHRLVLTNNHCIQQFIRNVIKEVVEDGVVVKKEVPDNRDVPISQKSYAGHRVVGLAEYNTIIVYRDPGMDLALLQFRADSIPHTLFSPIFMGEVIRGQTVYVVGNPLGLDASISRGIVSSTNRFIKVGVIEFAYIHVDAGMAGGSSGGALYDEFGELLGVPAAVARVGQIGLAIPVFYIRQFLTDACYAIVFDDSAASHADCVDPPDPPKVVRRGR